MKELHYGEKMILIEIIDYSQKPQIKNSHSIVQVQ